MRVIVIGNGIAGVNAASACKGVGGEAVTVDIYSAERHPFYSRVRLPEVLSGESAPGEITFYKDDWYEKKGIAVHTGVEALSIDRPSKAIVLADGSRVSYDYLILATGASSNRPPIPGADLRGVFTMRTLEDVAAIRENLAAHPESASVIGGGLLGLEAARALKTAGARSVRVFELFPRLLPRQLDDAGAALLRERFGEMGIDVVCGAETEALLPVDGARALSIALKDGRSFASDTTILSMGVHSNTGLAASASLAVKRGIVVDRQMRTSDPFIFAVGDCAEFDGIVWGIIPAALEQAPVAARAILADASIIPASESPCYVQTVPKTALKIGGIELMSLGKAVLSPEEDASGRYTVRTRVWEGGLRYEKYVLAPAEPSSASPVSPASVGELHLVGAILYGSKANQSKVQKLMGKPATEGEIDALLAD